MWNLRTWKSLAAAAALAALADGAAHAAPAWPGKTVTLIVPYTAGGTADAVARRLADELRVSGTTVIVENKAGAGGSLGAEYVARSAPDGATLLLTATSPITIFPNLAKTQYDPLASFVPIGSAAVGPVVIAATSALQVRNFAALLAKAREKPDQLTFGVPGLGSVAHLGMAALMEQTDTKMRQIPYRGNSQALTDGLGGVVDLLVTNSDVLLPHVASGAIKPLAVMAPARLAAWPDVPTTAELGLPGVRYFSNYGLFAPAGVSAEVSQAIEAALRTAVEQERYQGFLKSSSLQPGTGIAAAFREQIRQEVEDNRQLIKSKNIGLD